MATPSSCAPVGKPQKTLDVLAFDPPKIRAKCTMRYDAYRLPGVRWLWVGFGKSPEPDCWPSHVVIEGQRVETVRGNGWGLTRAYYKCPVCRRNVKSLYSPTPIDPNPDNPVVAEQHSSTASTVACKRHWPKWFGRQQDDLLALRRAGKMGRNNRWLARSRRIEQDVTARLASIV